MATGQQALREAYDMYYQAAYEQADRDCRGELFSKAGNRARLTERQLWQLPMHDAARLASEELLEWWQINGRVTWQEYQDQALAELPWGTVEAVARPITYYWAKVTICGPDGTQTLTCTCQYGHERPDLAIKHARQLAARRGLKLAA